MLIETHIDGYVRDKVKQCKIDGCNTVARRKGYCGRHYTQILIYGEILKRTRHDKNEITINGDVAEIHLYDIHSNEIAVALIDASDAEIVKDYKWYLKDGYVCSKFGNKILKLHRIIMNTPKGMDTDHINHNKLDNRKCNLRICTRSENSMNRKCQGVSFIQSRDKWRARIQYYGKEKTLGYFETFGEAVNARREAEKLYFGDYAYKEGINC